MELVTVLPSLADVKCLTPYGAQVCCAPLTVTVHGVHAFPTAEHHTSGQGLQRYNMVSVGKLDSAPLVVIAYLLGNPTHRESDIKHTCSVETFPEPSRPLLGGGLTHVYADVIFFPQPGVLWK